MPIEIERKFLVTSSEWKSVAPAYYCQGYLSRDPHRTVRVRVAGDQAFLTVKGLNRGATRAEYEFAIPVDQANEMLELCEPSLIRKNRRVISYGGLQWEIDEFLGDNLGLVIAEIELDSEQQNFELPPWVGTEVTDDSRYFNSNLSGTPFAKWGNATESVVE